MLRSRRNNSVTQKVFTYLLFSLDKKSPFLEGVGDEWNRSWSAGSGVGG
jgi:hypothetical protein